LLYCVSLLSSISLPIFSTTSATSSPSSLSLHDALPILMFLVLPICVVASPSTLIKSLVLSPVVISTGVITGCATKPQVNNATRYATAPDFYTVRSGDTLSGIAARYGLNYISVAEMNDISAPYRIYVGQSIRLKNNTVRRSTSTQAVTQAAPIQRQTIAVPTPAPVTPAT